MKGKTHIQKEYEGRWSVYNTSTGKSAYIVKIEEFGFLASSKSRYRVDNGKGETIASMIDHFSTAKSIATKEVK